MFAPREDGCVARAADVELIQDLTTVSRPDSGYLRRRRVRARTLLSDGTKTAPYIVDWVERAPGREDAVALVVHAESDDPRDPWVLLRRQLRVPLHRVTGCPLSLELVAGILEPERAPAEMAAIEAWEEAGLEVRPEQIRPLGQPTFPVAASFTERIHLMEVEVEPQALDHLSVPPTDGSPMEAGADLWRSRLSSALGLAHVPPSAEGELFLVDAKTEIGLHRLARRLAQ